VVTSERFEVKECSCEQCGHRWVPAITREKGKLVQPDPVACSKCKSAYWNRTKR